MYDQEKQTVQISHQCKVKTQVEIIRTILKTFTFKTTRKNVSQGWTQWGPHTYTIYLFIIFVIKQKKLILWRLC